MYRTFERFLILSAMLLSFFLAGCVISPKEVKYVYLTAPDSPSITVNGPTNGDVIHTNASAVFGTASVATPYTIANVQVKVNNGSYTAATGTTNWAISGVSFTNGLNSVTVMAVSDTNKTNSVIINFNYDTTVVSTNSDTYTPGSGWGLLWSDEFNDTSINTANWTHEQVKWPHNSEMEYYTARLNNSWTANGHLVIKAIKETYSTANYTSARIHSKNKVSLLYGKIAARIRMPYGINQWPAFWLLGTNDSTSTWPACGEVDIVEYRGDRINVSTSAVHGPSYSGDTPYHASYTLPSGNFTNSFHVFEAVWTNNCIHFYVDSTYTYTLLKSTVTGSGFTWVFDKPFYIILNLGIASAGTPYTGYQAIDDTVFPTYMFVDWVRVYTN